MGCFLNVRSRPWSYHVGLLIGILPRPCAPERETKALRSHSRAFSRGSCSLCRTTHVCSAKDGSVEAVKRRAPHWEEDKLLQDSLPTATKHLLGARQALGGEHR